LGRHRAAACAGDVQSLLYGWVLGIDKGEQAMHVGAHLRVPRFVQFMLKYISPVYLLAIMVALWPRKTPRTGSR